MKKYKDLDELAADTDKAGGTAFPAHFESGNMSHSWHGMTLRDYFAAKAMQGDLASQDRTIGVWKDDAENAAYLARRAFIFADAMIAERNKPNES